MVVKTQNKHYGINIFAYLLTFKLDVRVTTKSNPVIL